MVWTTYCCFGLKRKQLALHAKAAIQVSRRAGLGVKARVGWCISDLEKEERAGSDLVSGPALILGVFTFITYLILTSAQ